MYETDQSAALADINAALAYLKDQREPLEKSAPFPAHIIYEQEEHRNAYYTAMDGIQGALQWLSESISIASLEGDLTYDSAVELLRSNGVRVDSEPATEYSMLIESLEVGTKVAIYTSDAGHGEVAVINDVVRLYVHTDVDGTSARAAIMIPVRYDDDIIEHEVFYLHKTRDSDPGTMLVPGLELA